MVTKTSIKKRVPKHRQVRRWFLDQVASQQFKPGEQVPGESELMSIHNVSRATVRRAMDELEFEGLIRRYRGKGSFLLSPADARRQDKAKTFRLGCIVRHWVAGREGLLSGIETLAQSGHELFVEYVGDTERGVRSAIDRMLKFGVTGMVIEPSPYLSHELYRPLFDANVVVVWLDSAFEDFDAAVITLDHRQSAHDAATCLLQLKHRRIGYVSSPRYWTVDRQLQGISEAMQEHGLTMDDELLSFEPTIADEQSYSERGFQACLNLLSTPDPPTAIITINDETAANAYRAIKSRGLRIPHDFSVIAICSCHQTLATSMDPPLTVWHDWSAYRGLGEKAAKTLDRLCQDNIAPLKQTIFVEPAIMPRGSVSLAPGER